MGKRASSARLYTSKRNQRQTGNLQASTPPAGNPGLRLSGGGLGLGRDWAGAAKFLPLQDEICKEQREGYTGPDDGFHGGFAEIFPAGHTTDNAYLQKNESDGEAAGHPPAVLLDFSVEDENHGDAGGEDPKGCIDGSGDAEGAGGTHTLLVVLNVETKWSSYEDPSDIEATNDAVEFNEALAETVGELHWPKKKRAGAG